jgi:hypothetical protein
LSVAPGGELWLPTGRIVACGPFVHLGAGDDAESEGAFPRADGDDGDEGPLWDAFETDAWSPGPHMITDEATGHTVAAFTPGWGDGACPTWAGHDTAGEVSPAS